MLFLKLNVLVLLASLLIAFSPESAQSLGDFFVIPLLATAWSIWTLLTGPLNSWESGVSTDYAFAPEGYADEDHLYGLVPKFEPLSRQAPPC